VKYIREIRRTLNFAVSCLACLMPALYTRGSSKEFKSWRPAIITEVYCCYPQFLQENDGILSLNGE
jgi:hypothetical protein